MISNRACNCCKCKEVKPNSELCGLEDKSPSVAYPDEETFKRLMREVIEEYLPGLQYLKDK